MVDERTGKLVRIDGAKLQPSSPSGVPGLEIPNLEVLTGGGRSYVVDRSSGIVQQLDPRMLRPIGPPVALHSPISQAVIDRRGSLWAAVPGQGAVTEIDGSRVAAHQVVGQDDDAISVGDTSTCVVAVDASSGMATCVSKSGATVHFKAGRNEIPVVAASPSSPNLVSVEGTQAIEINLTDGTSKAASLPQGTRVTQAVLNGNSAYLLNSSSQQVDVINLTDATLGQALSPPGGVTDLVVGGGVVFANDANGSQALAIAPTGSRVPIQKYDPEHPFADVAPAGTGTSNAVAGGQTPAVVPVAPALRAPLPSVAGPVAPANPTPAKVQLVGPTPAAAARPSAPAASVVAGPPGQPTGVRASPGNASITVSWLAPVGGTPASSFNVTDTEGHREQVSATTVIFTGLRVGMQDCAVVQAVSASGAGGPLSSVPACATPATPAAATTTVPPTTTTIPPTTTTTVPPTTTTTLATDTLAQDLAAGVRFVHLGSGFAPTGIAGIPTNPPQLPATPPNTGTDPAYSLQTVIQNGQRFLAFGTAQWVAAGCPTTLAVTSSSELAACGLSLSSLYYEPVAGGPLEPATGLGGTIPSHTPLWYDAGPARG